MNPEHVAHTITDAPAAPLQTYTITDASGRTIQILGAVQGEAVHPAPGYGIHHQAAPVSAPVAVVDKPLVPRVVKQAAIYAVGGGLSLYVASLALGAFAAALAELVAAIVSVLTVLAYILGSVGLLVFVKWLMSSSTPKGVKNGGMTSGTVVNNVSKGVFARNSTKVINK